MAIKFTRNACEKLKQIMNLKENAAKKLIGRAYVWGTDIRDLPSRERDYFLIWVDTGKRNAYVYAGCCFVFAGDYCVTVIKSPNWSRQKSRYDGKTKVKNPKKYIKYHSIYDCEAIDGLCA